MTEPKASAPEEVAPAVHHRSAQPVVIAPRTLAMFVAIFFGAALLLALIYATRWVCIELLAAIILAMALEPVVQFFQSRKIPRSGAVGITYALATLAVSAFAIAVVPVLVEQAAKFAQQAPGLVQHLVNDTGWFHSIEERFHVVENVQRWAVEHGGATLGEPALRAVGGLVNGVAGLVTASFFALFISLTGRQSFDTMLELFPESTRARSRRVGQGIMKAVGGYVLGNLLTSVIAGLFTLILLLLLHLPFPVVIALVVAVFDLIPIVGAMLGTICVGLVALTHGLVVTAIAVVAMRVYDMIENRVLVPMVYHRTVKLSALAITVSVVAGAELGGIVGALFAIPVAGALNVAYGELLAWRRGADPTGEPVQVGRKDRDQAIKVARPTPPE